MDPKIILAYSPIIIYLAILWQQGTLLYVLLTLPVLVLCIILSCYFTDDHGYASLFNSLFSPTFENHSPGDSAIVITGISRGLGNALANHFASSGFLVIGSCRKEEDLTLLLKQGNGNIFPVIMDHSKSEEISSGCEQIVNILKIRHKRLGALICSAGITCMGPFECLPMDTFRNLFNTNVQGHMDIIHTLIKRIRMDKSRIVIMGAPDLPPAQYCYKTVCNSALLGFTRALRSDLTGLGVSISLIQPAATRGGMVIEAPKMIKSVRATMTPEEIKIYPPAFKSILKASITGKDFGFDPSWATNAVDHAVASAHPKTRYSTTPLGTVLYLLCSLLPDRMIEAFAYYGPLGPGKVQGLDFD